MSLGGRARANLGSPRFESDKRHRYITIGGDTCPRLLSLGGSGREGLGMISTELHMTTNESVNRVVAPLSRGSLDINQGTPGGMTALYLPLATATLVLLGSCSIREQIC